MAGRNRLIRKAILTILWESDKALTKEEILTAIEADTGRFYINATPTSNTIGSLLSKSTQIIRGEQTTVFAGDGRNRKVPTFAINRSLIKTERDLLLTTPFGLLDDDDKLRAVVCVGCARKRIPQCVDLCLECFNATLG